MNNGWEKAKLLFDEALKLQPSDRPLFLRKACDGNEEIFREVHSLLDAYVDDSFLETPAGAAVTETLIADAANLSAGQVLNHYKIVRQLGAGGMGEVYLATDTKLHRNVALKVLPAEFMLDPDRSRRFQQEAHTASALNHPNILTIHEIGEFEDTIFIASEFIEGDTLRDKLVQGPLPLSEALDVALQTASALVAAHESGIVHRDIKPENIMIRGDHLVKVLDFGLAKLTSGSAFGASPGNRPRVETASGVIMGTTAYMSPEQARGKDTDARTDIFSFGIVFYEMLTGQIPFAGETTSDILAAILKSEPFPISQFAPEIPAELESIVQKALRKNRSERYQNTNELVTDLRQVKRDLEFGSQSDRLASVYPSPLRTEVTRIQTSTSSAEYLVSELKNHKLAAVAVLLVTLLGIAAISYFTAGNSPVSETGSADSIAVLPFENVGQDVNTEYLSDGVAETLINRLSQLSNLRVMSSSAVFRYKGSKPDIQIVAEELKVTAVLTGSVRKIGEQLVINVSLDGKDNRRIWGEQYRRPVSDVLSVQSDIAQEVASNLRLKLTGGDERQLTKRYTESAEAYQLYLKGNYHWKKNTPEDSRKGIDYYNQAIELDPSYAMAYTGLANSYGIMALAFLPPREGFSKAKMYAANALELDETLADAHSSMGAVRVFYDWDWVEAEKELKTALELNPNHFDANIVYPALLSALGRFDESRPIARRGVEMEPLSAWTNTQLGIDLFLGRQFDESIMQFEKTINLEPRFMQGYLGLGQSYVQKKMYPRAIETFQRGIGQAGPNSHLVSSLGHAYAVSGEHDKARQSIDQLHSLSKQVYVSPYAFAIIYAGLGDRDQTFAWLEKAFEDRYFEMIRLKVEPLFDPFRDDPRFQDLLQRMNFPE